MSRPNLVLLRHGESVWNVHGLATGWADVPLTEAGREHAAAAGRTLAAEGLRFDVVYTSMLRRAVDTAACVVDAAAPPPPPVIALWQLNERHVGQLQGLDRDAVKRRWGNERRRRWRADPNALPPPLDDDDPRHPRHDPRFAGLPRPLLPSSERIRDLRRRVLAAWHEQIGPVVRAGGTVAVVAHRDSLRALISELEGIDIGAFANMRIPPATPRRYVLAGDLTLLSSTA